MSGRFSIEAVFKAIDRFSRPFAQMQTGFGRLTRSISRGVEGANAAINKVGASLYNLGKVAAIAGAAVGAGLFKIGKTGADFEEAITAVGAVGLQTRDQIAGLEKQAIDLGASTQFSATEVANAMELMARAGFKNSEIMEGVGGVLNAAAASGLEMAEVAGVVSNALKGMGLDAKEASRVADVLALASSRTNSTIGTLGESMKNLAPVARQLNIPFEQAVASVALLQDVGLDASEAGTATATMLTKLAAPSKEVAAQMRNLGIAFQDAQGNALPLPEILGEFDKAAKKSGGNMKVLAFFSDLVGLRGQKAALNLKDLFASGKMATLSKELENAAGAAGKMAALRMNNLKGDVEQLGGAVDSLQIALFNTQSGPLRGIVQKMTDWVGKNQAVIVSGFSEFVGKLGEALPKVGDALERIGRAAAPVLAVVAAVKLWTVAQAALGLIMAANPLTLWIIGLTAFAALVAAFWPEISAFFSNVWNGAKNMAATVWDWIKSTMTGLGEFLVGLVAMVFPFLIPAFQAIVAAAGWVIDNWAPVAGFFGAVWQKIVAAARWAYDMFVSIWSPIASFFSSLWDSAAGAFKSAFGWVLDKLGWAVDAVRKVGRGLLGTDGGDTPRPEVSSPEERVARNISETTSRGEVTIKDETGRAKITKPVKSPGFGVALRPSGAF